jgi:hydrogenase maturation protease
VAERLVLGIGNPDRGDDAVGRLVARSLKRLVPADVRVAERDGEAAALLAELESAQRAWLVDAARSGARPGTVHRIDCSAVDLALPPGTVSSHGFGVAEAIGLARALDVLPPHCIVYAIETTDFTPGATPSPAVTSAVDVVAARILMELATPPPPSSCRRWPPAPVTGHR